MQPNPDSPARRLPLACALAFAAVVSPSFAAEPAPTTVLDASQAGEALVIVDEPTQRFEVNAGESWRDALTRWSRDAGYTLVWRAPADVLIEAPIHFDEGTDYETAVGEVLKALWHSRYAVVGSLYRNRVLVITGRDA